MAKSEQEKALDALHEQAADEDRARAETSDDAPEEATEAPEATVKLADGVEDDNVRVRVAGYDYLEVSTEPVPVSVEQARLLADSPLVSVEVKS